MAAGAEFRTEVSVVLAEPQLCCGAGQRRDRCEPWFATNGPVRGCRELGGRQRGMRSMPLRNPKPRAWRPGSSARALVM
jgi:hypothetical protein